MYRTTSCKFLIARARLEWRTTFPSFVFVGEHQRRNLCQTLPNCCHLLCKKPFADPDYNAEMLSKVMTFTEENFGGAGWECVSSREFSVFAHHSPRLYCVFSADFLRLICWPRGLPSLDVLGLFLPAAQKVFVLLLSSARFDFCANFFESKFSSFPSSRLLFMHRAGSWLVREDFFPLFSFARWFTIMQVSFRLNKWYFVHRRSEGKWPSVVN